MTKRRRERENKANKQEKKDGRRGRRVSLFRNGIKVNLFAVVDGARVSVHAGHLGGAGGANGLCARRGVGARGREAQRHLQTHKEGRKTPMGERGRA
jgi:hypothetical protein